MGEDNIERELANLALTDSYDVQSADRLSQVEKAVDAAHATIMQQLAENYLLRTELQRQNEELKKYKLGHENNHSELPDHVWDEQENEVSTSDPLVLHSDSQIGGNGNVDAVTFSADLVYQTSLIKGNENQIVADKAGTSQLTSTFSMPTRHDESNSESEFKNSRMMPITAAEANVSIVAKQEILQKNQEQENEILQLKMYLTEFSLRESKLCDEKLALEKRISHMHLVFDQQQQDLVSSTSKANSYKQDIMEENVRLTYALQAAKEEESKFVNFLIPLLSKYDIEPPVANAQAIVSNVKVLFRHLQEQLRSAQEKLKESEYELAIWYHEQKNGLDLVPQPLYSGSMMVNSHHHMETIEDTLGSPQTGLDDSHRTSPITSRNIASDNMFSPNPYLVPKDEGTVSRKVTFGDNVIREMDEPESRRHPDDRESSADQNSKHASGTPDDPVSYSPSLPTVLEEPSSSFSEATEDDPLPAIEGLQISGNAYPGEELQASGFSVNGTTICNFEWIRHFEDGSFIHIDGAQRPSYLVTADDVDTCLAIQVQPLDNRKRKGNLVTVFANEHRKITLGPLLNCIQKTLNSGHASFKLMMFGGYFSIWEPATLAVKRRGFNIKCSGANGGVVARKFSSSILVSISHESPTMFSIVDSMGNTYTLQTEISADISCSRDTIVLTLRLFILKAVEKKNKKKRFFYL